jgi:acyl-CoA synthetase (NDP forming)
MAFSLFRKPEKKVVKHSKPKPKPVKKVIIHKKVSKPAHKPVHKPAHKPQSRPESKVVPKPVIKLPIVEKMDDSKAYEMIKSAKLPTLKTVFLKSEKDLPLLKSIGFPCMFKVSSPKIIHKTEVDGIVKVNTLKMLLKL